MSETIIIADSNAEHLENVERFLERYGVQDKVECRVEAGIPGGVLQVSAFDQDVKTFSKPLRFGCLLEVIEGFSDSHGDDNRVFGSYRFDVRQRVLVQETGEDISLTDREADILKYLLAAKGGVVSREDLLREVWGYREDLETHTLETHIYRLRQKIEDDPAKPRFIVTEEAGYSLSV